MGPPSHTVLTMPLPRHIAYSAYLQVAASCSPAPPLCAHHAAGCQARLARLGIACTFQAMGVHVPNEACHPRPPQRGPIPDLQDWDGVGSPYWLHDAYLVPHCTRDPKAEPNPKPSL